MAADASALRGLLEEDARRLAELLRHRHGPRATRQRARTALQRAWQQLAQADPEPGQAPSEAGTSGSDTADADLINAQAELASLRRHLDQAGWAAAIWPIGRLLLRRPLPERFRIPASVRSRDGLIARLVRRAEVDLAISDARVQYMEERCGGGPKVRVRGIREGDANRLPDSNFELLRKKGQSRFS